MYGFKNVRKCLYFPIKRVTILYTEMILLMALLKVELLTKSDSERRKYYHSITNSKEMRKPDLKIHQYKSPVDIMIPINFIEI